MLTPTEPRQWLVKSDDKPHGYGKDPYKRTIPELLDTGVINLDKPPGPTSHEVVSWVKGILHIKRAGHSGTLDPHVPGVLPMMLGDATRLVRVLLLSGKEYVCVMRLHADVPEKEVRQVLEEFTGTIYQRPPLVSAVKRQVRKRTIYYIKFLEKAGRDVLFIVGQVKASDVSTACPDPSACHVTPDQQTEITANVSSANTLRVVGAVVGGVGLVSAGVGAYMLLSKTKEAKPTSASRFLDVTPSYDGRGGLGLAARGRF
jgi:predicted rRNA pseudouridine synthase